MVRGDAGFLRRCLERLITRSKHLSLPKNATILDRSIAVHMPIVFRLHQNTFFPEDDTDGKPDAILKTGLIARLSGLNNSTLWNHKKNKLGTEFYDIIMMTPFGKRSLDSKEWKNAIITGNVSLSNLSIEDRIEVVRYGLSKGKKFIESIIEAASYKASARVMYELLYKLDANMVESGDYGAAKRTLGYWKWLNHKPTADDYAALKAQCGWIKSSTV